MRSTFTMGAVTAVAALLAGCASTGTNGVVKIGPDDYMLGGLGGMLDHSGAAVKARFYGQASEFCTKLGRVMVPTTSASQDAAGFTYVSMITVRDGTGGRFDRAR